MLSNSRSSNQITPGGPSLSSIHTKSIALIRQEYRRFNLISPNSSGDVPYNHFQGITSRILLPLQKQRVYELINPEKAFVARWDAMNRRRMEDIARKDERKATKEGRLAFHTAVVASDRISSDYAISAVNNVHSANIIGISKLKTAKDVSNANKKHQAEEEKARKYREVAILRHALLSSSLISDASLVVGEFRKRREKSESMKLSSESSSMLDVPSVLKDQVKSAKSLKEFEAARQQIADFKANTISERMNKYAERRVQASRMAGLSKEATISVLPLSGDSYFIDESELEDSPKLRQSHRLPLMQTQISSSLSPRPQSANRFESESGRPVSRRLKPTAATKVTTNVRAASTSDFEESFRKLQLSMEAHENIAQSALHHHHLLHHHHHEHNQQSHLQRMTVSPRQQHQPYDQYLENHVTQLLSEGDGSSSPQQGG